MATDPVQTIPPDLSPLGKILWEMRGHFRVSNPDLEQGLVEYLAEQSMPYMTEKMIEGAGLVDRFANEIQRELSLPLEDVAVLLLAAAGRLLSNPNLMPSQDVRRQLSGSIVEIVVTGQERSLVEETNNGQ